MIEVRPVDIDGTLVTGITVELPQTRLSIISAGPGYLMCGALDIAVLDRKLPRRRIIAARALGVRSIDDLLEQPLEAVTTAARRDFALERGMTGREAVRRLLRAEVGNQDHQDPAGP